MSASPEYNGFVYSEVEVKDPYALEVVTLHYLTEPVSKHSTRMDTDSPTSWSICVCLVKTSWALL